MEWREGVPRWVQIADELERRIQEGEYPPGSHVPSVLKLMDEFQVASATAQKALAALAGLAALAALAALAGLRNRGLTRPEPGIGATVREG